MRVMNSPRMLDLEITSRCNARCRYCYYMNNQGVTYEDMSTQKWLDLFEEAGKAAVMSVCFAGGEPLIREDIFELIDGVVRNRMRFQILTNGRLVDRGVARRLKAGTVWVNTYNVYDTAAPFGGYKQSGFGREMSAYALEHYTQVKSVWVDLNI